MIPKSIQDKLNALALEFGQQLLRDVQRVFEKNSRTGELHDSPQLTITRSTDTTAPHIVITYADQGFFIGQKNPQWTKVPNMDKMLEWGKNVQLNGVVPGYKNGMAPNLPPWKIKQRQLWAIAKSKQKFDKHKRRTWKKEAKLPELLKQLNTTAIEAFNLEVERILNAALEGLETS